MLRGMTMKQLFEWERFYALEPIGERRADYHAASIRQMIHAVNVADKKNLRPVEDFLLGFTEEDKERQKKRQEEAAWSAAQFTSAQARAYAEVLAEREAQNQPPPQILED